MRALCVIMALLTFPACLYGSGTATESASSPLSAAPGTEIAQWKRVGHLSLPATRFGQAVAWDEARGVLVMFGGVAGTPDMSQIPQQDTWEWDLATNAWKPRPTAGTAPDARSGAAMVYDSARKLFVLFGGRPGNGYDLQDTWEWDPATGIWTDKTGPGSGPGARSQHGMIFDSKTGKVVLFGGGRCQLEENNWTDLSATFADTWEYDGTRWIQRTTPTAPSARAGFGFAYSSATHKAYLFGGLEIIDYVGPGTPKQDIWEYDGTAGTWTEHTATGSKPSARFGQGMAIDSANGLAVVFGGSDIATGSKNDVWYWNLASGTWQGHEAASASPWPGERQWASLVMGGSPARAFLVAGSIDFSSAGPDAGAPSVGYSVSTRDVWELNPSTTLWVDRSAAKDSPGVRVGHAMTSDPVTGRVYVFGGMDESERAFDDLWEWNGSNWVECTGSVRPPTRIGSAMGYDPARRSLILFGGTPLGLYVGDVFLGDTWEWNIGTRTWTQLFPARSPAGRDMHAMVTDTTRQRIILVYGSDWPFTDTSGKLWEWDGATSTWTDRTPSTIPNEDPLGLVYDEGRKKVVLLGNASGSANSKYWEWDSDSGQWEQLVLDGVVDMPDSVTHDSIRRRIVSVVATDDVLVNPQSMSTYELDLAGPTWYESVTTEAPNDRLGSAMAFDKKRGVVVLFGGWTVETGLLMGCTDTWEYRVSSWANGSGCTDAFASQCASGHCVDGVCCESTSCQGVCQSCNVAGKAGTCALAAPGTQILGSCSGDLACDASGACKTATGKACTGASECASGFCVDGVCCNTACTGACAACNQPGKEGTCRPFAAGTDPQNECSKGTPPCQSTCDGRGGCIYPSGTECGACGTCNGSGLCQEWLYCPHDGGIGGAGGQGSGDGGIGGVGGHGGNGPVAGTGGVGGSNTGGQGRAGATAVGGAGGMAGSTGSGGSTRTGGAGGGGGGGSGAAGASGTTTMTDASIHDGGLAPTDGAPGGKRSDTGIGDGGRPDAQTIKLGHSGCGCRLGATRSSQGASILLLMGIAWLSRRARSRADTLSRAPHLLPGNRAPAPDISRDIRNRWPAGSGEATTFQNDAVACARPGSSTIATDCCLG